MPPIATIVAAATSEMASHNGNEPWISLESAAWWFDKSSIVLAVSLFIGFVCTVIIIVTGIAKEHHWDLAREAAARKTELLRAENLAFEKYIGPRSVDERALAGALAGHPAGQIEVVLLNHVFDGQKLAEPFVRLLQKAGWGVTLISPENSSEEELTSIARIITDPRGLILLYSASSPDRYDAPGKKPGNGWTGSLKTALNAMVASKADSAGRLKEDGRLAPDTLRILIAPKDPH